MKRLILTNSRGGISINVDIEVVPLCNFAKANYTQHRFYGDIHIVFQIVYLLSAIALG